MMKHFSIRSKTLYGLMLLALLSVSAGIPRSQSRQTDSIVFAVIGDYGIAGQPEADVANLVKSWNPDFIVTVGDNNYPNGAAYSIDQNIGQYYHDYIYKYNGKYGSGSETRRFFPALGNHDWHKYSANAYTNYFNLPGNERYYDFIYGPVHFFVLDSVKDEEDGNTLDSPQAKWLKNGMTASVSPFKIVVTHYPPYSSGKHGEVPFMQWQFKAWGADAILSGHDHDYERLEIDGLPHFVNGLGGDELGNFRAEILPQSQFRYNGNYGAMRVEANSASMKFQFYSRDYILIDEYLIGTAAATATPSPTPTFAPTETETPFPTFTIAPTDFFTASAEPTFAPTETETPLPTFTAAPTDFFTASAEPTFAPTETPAPSETPFPTFTATPTDFFTASAEPTFAPTETPAPTVTIIPTAEIISAPILFSPADNAILSARYFFTWQPIYNATRYHIEIDNNADFSRPEWSSWRRDPEYQISSMPKKSAYYWRVRAKDGAGNWSAWSTVFKLNVP